MEMRKLLKSIKKRANRLVYLLKDNYHSGHIIERKIEEKRKREDEVTIVDNVKGGRGRMKE